MENWAIFAAIGFIIILAVFLLITVIGERPKRVRDSEFNEINGGVSNHYVEKADESRTYVPRTYSVSMKSKRRDDASDGGLFSSIVTSDWSSSSSYDSSSSCDSGGSSDGGGSCDGGGGGGD